MAHLCSSLAKLLRPLLPLLPLFPTPGCRAQGLAIAAVRRPSGISSLPVSVRLLRLRHACHKLLNFESNPSWAQQVSAWGSGRSAPGLAIEYAATGWHDMGCKGEAQQATAQQAFEGATGATPSGVSRSQCCLHRMLLRVASRVLPTQRCLGARLPEALRALSARPPARRLPSNRAINAASMSSSSASTDFKVTTRGAAAVAELAASGRGSGGSTGSLCPTALPASLPCAGVPVRPLEDCCRGGVRDLAPLLCLW